MKVEQLIDQFDLVTDTEEGFEQLREVILELAFKGGLTKQNSENESAVKLLKRIDAEKQRLYDEGEIRKPKDPDEVSGDEIPYLVPDGWTWTNVQNLFFTISTSGKKIKKRDFLEEGEFPVIDQGQDYIGGFTNEESKLIDIPRDVVIFGDHTREVKYVDFNFVAGADGIKIFCPALINAKYFYWLLKNVKLTDRGYARHFKLLKQEVVPLAPLEEQQLIVQKIETLFSQVDELEQKVQQDRQVDERLQVAVLDDLQSAETSEASQKSWQRLTDHFEQIYRKPEHVDQLKQAILNEAVRGRLVPQDPNDEPAEKLLERIKEEKQRLYDDGKIRKPKDLSEIKDEDKEYSLPNRWAWCRLSDITTVITDGEHITPDYLDDGVPILSAKHVGDRDIIFEDYKYVSEEDAEKFLSKCNPEENDILVVSRGGGVGRTIILDDHPKFALMGSVLLFKPTQIINKYLYYYLVSKEGNEKLKTTSSSTAQQAIYITHLRKTYFLPLPPYDEQKRIVEKVDELFRWCDNLKDKLSRSQQTDQRLLEALVNGHQ